MLEIRLHSIALVNCVGGFDVALKDMMSWWSRHDKGFGDILEVQTKYPKIRQNIQKLDDMPIRKTEVYIVRKK